MSGRDDASIQDLASRTRAWACYDCGKCTATCPISRAGADYSPRRHVLETNLELSLAQAPGAVSLSLYDRTCVPVEATGPCDDAEAECLQFPRLPPGDYYAVVSSPESAAAH